MEWLTLNELALAYGHAIGWGACIGALVALFNSWRA